MGWFLGLAGKYSDSDLRKINLLHPSSLYSLKTNKLYLAAGGIIETCIGSISEETSSGWIICGLGIKYENEGAAFMNAEDWDQELSAGSFNQYTLNGHFAAAKWNKDKVELYTDQLGIRKIYLTKLNECVAFSTRPDWIAKVNPNVVIDWDVFGSRWLLFNQITPKIFLLNVKELNQAGRSIIELDSPDIKLNNQPWHPDLVNVITEKKDFISVLRDFTLCKFENKDKSLALSGGIDSRILLAFLLSSNTKNWSVHTFNLPEHPDTKTAKEISEKLNIDHTPFEPSIQSAGNFIPILSECIGETILASPASKFLLMQFYSSLHNQIKVVIDGAYGEIARRRFLNMLLIKGREAILNYESEKIIGLLKFTRAEIFKDDIVKRMKHGIRRQIEDVFYTMPPVKIFGVENWIDLFALRNRFVQSSVEQARSDRMVVNYMPFIQPSLLKIVFETPAKNRNNKLFYKKIKELYSPLSDYPLVKGNVTYPFGLGNLSTSLLVKVKSKIGFGYKDDLLIRFLKSLSEYVQDTVNSQDFITCEYYDQNKIKRIIDGFYRENKLALASQVDWWLTFDIWRKTLSN